MVTKCQTADSHVLCKLTILLHPFQGKWTGGGVGPLVGAWAVTLGRRTWLGVGSVIDRLQAREGKGHHSTLGEGRLGNQAQC